MLENTKYVDVIYNDGIRPVTTYPQKLIQYLISKYNIEVGSKILDSGCGRGDFAEAFAQAGMDVVGIDGYLFDQNRCTTVNYVGGIDLELGNLPFNDNIFDIVFSKSVLEHIHKPEHYLNEIMRVLKPGGKIIVLVPDWYTQMYIFYDDFSHVQPYTKRGLHDTLCVFGFEKVRTEVFYQLPSVWKHSCIKVICRALQILGGPVKKLSKNKFYRFSRELMLLSIGEKGKDL